MAALENISYSGHGLDVKPKANMNDHFNIDIKDINYQNVLYNTLMFRKINGIFNKKIEKLWLIKTTPRTWWVCMII